MRGSTLFWQKIRLNALMIGMIAIAGCTHTASISGNGTTTSGPGSAATDPQPSIFTDLPIPQGAKLNIDQTLVVGTENWVGQLVLEASGNAYAIFDFYRAGLGTFGWKEITSVRGPESVLAYERGQRILQMQIKAGALTGSIITITVSPRGITPSSGS